MLTLRLLTLNPVFSMLSFGSILLLDSDPDNSVIRSRIESAMSVSIRSVVELELDDVAAMVAAVLQPYINTFFLREWP